jgi:DNA-directed RNA polymerase specialized sigma24 family protein
LREISFTALQKESKHIARQLQGSFGVSKMDAEDAMSAAWEVVLERKDLRFEGFPKLRAWVTKDARFRLMDLKKHRRVLKIEKFEDRKEEAEKSWNHNVLEHLFDGRDSHLLMLKYLTIHERSVIMVHHWLELSFEEMAEWRTDGMTAETLRQRYHRAMEKLKACVKRQEPTLH